MKEIAIEAEGKIIFKEIKYCDEIITFKDGQELVINYSKYSGEDFITIIYDFGMSDRRTGFNINTTSIEDFVKIIVKYDVEHAFCHPNMDPNYGKIHWTIKGWLKDRVLILEDPDIELEDPDIELEDLKFLKKSC